jgi:hypothetical protein
VSTHADADLGHTVAGWTGTTIAILGSTVCGLGVVAASAALILVGVAILALAALATWMLHLTGWGKPSGPRPPGQRDWRVKDLEARYGHPNCLGCRIARPRPTKAPQLLADPVAAETHEPEKTVTLASRATPPRWNSPLQQHASARPDPTLVPRLPPP